MCSAGLAKLAVWLCGHVTAEVAEQILDHNGGVVCSDTRIWRRVAKWGEKIQVVEAAHQAVANALPPRGSGVPVPVVTSQEMGASMDGIKINVRGEGWKELKVGCVFEIEMRPAPNAKTAEMVEHAHAVNNSYTAHLGEPAPFGRALGAAACRREMPQARDSVILGDGAVWIWNLVGEHFAGSRQVVDWYHATEYLYQAAHLA